MSDRKQKRMEQRKQYQIARREIDKMARLQPAVSNQSRIKKMKELRRQASV